MGTTPADPPAYRMDPAGQDIYGEATRLRERAPVTLVELPGGVRAWAATRYDTVRELLADPRVSRDAYQHWTQFRAGEITPDWPLFVFVGLKNMLTAYGDEHRRLRGLIAKAFTTRRVAAMAPLITTTVHGLLDAMAAAGAAGGPVDLRAAFAAPLPLGVIADLFGVPAARRELLRRLIGNLIDTTAGADEVLATQQGLAELMSELVAGKRAAPGDDLATDLIAARDEDGSALTEPELLDTLLLVLAAGLETTVNLVENAVYALLTHPDQLALIRSGAATWDDAIEETLRWRPPAANMPLRYAVTDIEIGGVTIGRGEAILAAFGAASHDPRRHGDTAEEFDLTPHPAGTPCLRPRRAPLPRRTAGPPRSAHRAARPVRPVPPPRPRRAGRRTRTAGHHAHQRPPGTAGHAGLTLAGRAAGPAWAGPAASTMPAWVSRWSWS